MNSDSGPAGLPQPCHASWDEDARLAALERYGILDTGREPGFDDIAELAADILKAPIAVINFIAADRQWFKAEKGIGQDSLPLEASICRWAILQPGVFVVPDLAKDERFEHNPLVHVTNGLRFYAGALLETPEGLPLGAVCVLDRAPRPGGITARQKRALQALAAQAMAQLELRRSYAAARLENERLAAMFAQATVGISELRLDGRFMAVNDRLCEMLGRSREELLTLSFADVTHPEDVAVNLHRFQKLADGGESFTLDKRYMRPDGGMVWASSSVTRLLDERGRPRAALAVTGDITVRKAAERRRAFLLALTDRTNRLSDPQDVVAAATQSLGEELAATRIFYTERSAQGEVAMHCEWDACPGALTTDDALRRLHSALIAHLGPGRTLRVADISAQPSKEVWPLLETVDARAMLCTPLVRAGGTLGVLCVLQNAPRVWTDAEVELIETVAERTWQAVERARTENALRASEMRHRQVVEGAEDFAIIRLDQQGVVTAWNPGAARLTGFSETEAVGQSGAMLFTPQDRAEGVPEREVARAEKDGRAQNERWHQRKDGTVFWGSGLMMRLDGPDEGYLKIFRDRTTEHQAEARLRRRSEQLQELAEVATVVARASTLEATLDEITQAARRIVGSHQSVVSLTRGSDWKQAINAVGLSEKYARWKDYDNEPSGQGIYTWVCEENRPARLTQAELEAHPRWLGFGQHAKDHLPLRGWLAAPLIGRDGRNLGLIQLSDKVDGSEFDEADEAMLVQLAHLAAGAVEQAQADAALRELNRSLEQRVLDVAAERERAWRVSQELLGVVNADSTFAEVNAAWTLLLEWEPKDLLGRSIANFSHPDDLERTMATFQAILERPLAIPYEFRLRHRNGSYRWFSWTATFEAGRIYASGRDVNAEREREAQLEAADAARREADALYRAYFENTPDPLFVMQVEEDGGFTVAEINPAHESGVGMKIDSIRGKRVEAFLPPAAARRVLQSYQKVLETGGIYEYRDVFDLSEGPQYWDTTLVPVPDASGRIARIIGSSRNVTPQIVAEEALRQSQKMEAIGQLTGGIAHDFNNLLTPIVGGLDMLQRRALGGEREQRLIAGAAQSAERARTLVQRLLAFARRQPLQTVPVDVVKLVNEMVELLSSTLGPQIRIVIESGAGLAPAKADPNQLEMALLNLAVNARDAMPIGGTLHISVSEHKVDRQHRSGLGPGNYIRLSVADNGTGMDEATLQRAIEPFFSTKGIGKGTGLGLSMVHGLTAQLGGTLQIHSRPEHGTTAHLWLPTSTVAPYSPEVAAADVSATPAPTRVALLADDEELVRISTADMLVELGYRVLEVASGEEALRRVASGEHFDLLVTDYLMPGMNGADLAYAVQAARPGVPVLLVTGYAEQEGIDAQLTRLTKPFRKDELAASLSELALG